MRRSSGLQSDFEVALAIRSPVHAPRLERAVWSTLLRVFSFIDDSDVACWTMTRTSTARLSPRIMSLQA